MAKTENQKRRLIELLRVLWEKTDSEHGLTGPSILELLAGEGMECDRKTLYADIAVLQDAGFDIELDKSHGYRIMSRNFEIPELKLLVDAVQSSKFITKRKSSQLISKLEKLCSEYEAKDLRREVFVGDRVKTMNESIYYNVDDIYDAISSNCQISFHYFDYNIKKEKILRREGALYTVSPFALTWDDENYYLVAYDAEYDGLRHYRVDKMQGITKSQNKREKLEVYKDLNTAMYARKVFGMFGGEAKKVKMRFAERLAGVVIDRFGKETMMIPGENGTFTAEVEVVPSRQFLAWVFGLGPDAKILSPAEVAEDFRKTAESAAKIYD